MLVPLRFKIEEVEAWIPERGIYDTFADPFVPSRPTVYRIEIEFYDTDAMRPIVRGYELLRAMERPMEGYGSMTETMLEPGTLTEEHREYLQRLRDEVDGLLLSGWRDV